LIEQVDQRLRDWISNLLGITDISLAPPGESQAGRHINLYLLEVIPTLTTQKVKRPPLQLTLRYLLTVHFDDPTEAHRLLGDLIFAAMEQTDFQVEYDALPLSAWPSLNAVPQPSLILNVPLLKERPEPEIKPVRKAIFHAVPVVSLDGTVVGPEDMPLFGASVELPDLQLYTLTDPDGRFHFTAVPGEPSAKTLRVRAKGREMTVQVSPNSESSPLVIHFDLSES
jgi:uncharacterized protein DUF4255